MKNIAVFVSGNGTNFEAIISAIESGALKANCPLLVSDHEDAYAITRAKNHNVSVFSFSAKNFSCKAEYEMQIVKLLDENKIDLVVLAGYMRLIGDTLLEKYEGKIVNIHPALLPSFKGKHAIEQAFSYGVKVFGVTVHFVDSGMDSGKIIAQKSFDYVEGESVEEVEARIHEIEHVLYVNTLKKLLED